MLQRKGPEWRLLMSLLRSSRAVIAIDTPTAQALGGASVGAPVDHVPNCVLLGAIAPADLRNKRSVVYVGWVIPAKGVEDLLVAWGLVEGADLRLELIGACTQEYREDLHRRGLLDARTTISGEVPHASVVTPDPHRVMCSAAEP